MKGLHMAIGEIIKNPANEILRKKAKNVEKIDKNVLSILDDMAETLYKTGGNGLAAPQLGVSLRLIVIKDEGNYIKLINPEIVRSAGEQISLEGCLSLPGIYGIVKRPEYAIIKALDISGNPYGMKALHRLAAVAAHEIDHLEGILLIDKAIRIVNYIK
jgi:peptide deformylase